VVLTMPRIVLDLGMEQARVLQLLSVNSAMGGGTVQRALEYILSSIETGVLRPGSWEGELVRRLFGDDFDRKLDPDPQNPWRRRFQGKLGLGSGDETHVCVWRLAEDGDVPSAERKVLQRHGVVQLPKPTADGLDFAQLEDAVNKRGLPFLFAWPQAPALAANLLEERKHGTRVEPSAEALAEYNELKARHPGLPEDL